MSHIIVARTRREKQGKVYNTVDILWITKKIYPTGLLLEYILYSCILIHMSVTYQPKKRKRARKHGFLIKSRTKNGRKMIVRRRRKGRKKLAL